MNQLFNRGLNALLNDLRPHFGHPPRRKPSQALAAALPSLLDVLRPLVFKEHQQVVRRAQSIIGLPHFLDELRAPMATIKKTGLLCSPFSAAPLGRDEVRNASILAWFLNPRSGHGMALPLLNAILTRVAVHIPQFPVRAAATCVVRTESCPDDSRFNRVDIEIDDPNFFVIIEVKIDAPEQPQQIARYCEIAKRRSDGMRSWAVIFLTPSNKATATAAGWSDNVVPLSWREVATMLRQASPKDANGMITRFLSKSFANHINKSLGKRTWRKRKTTEQPEQLSSEISSFSITPQSFSRKS